MRIVTAFFAAILSMMVAGCGESANQGKTNTQTNDAAKLASLVTEFADTGSNQTMANYFTGGKKITPADHKKYISFSYQMEGTPSVSNGSAKGNVKISSNTDGTSSTKEWEFAQDNGVWKIKDAPLP
jgi:hypothetical protein